MLHDRSFCRDSNPVCHNQSSRFAKLIAVDQLRKRNASVFFPRVWPMSRKRLGPCMRISWKYIVQGQKVLGVGKSIEATKTKTTTKPKTTTRKSPSQTCVSPAETAKQTAETKQKPQNGARAQTKTPTESICHWTQWLIHCITIKNSHRQSKKGGTPLV